MKKQLIPETYEQWHHCITVLCKQPLTPEYINTRIKALINLNDDTTQKYVELYGEQQRLKTIQWFEKAKTTLSLS